MVHHRKDRTARLAYERQYRKDHHDEILERERMYRAEHSEEYRRHKRKYIENNPKKVRGWRLKQEYGIDVDRARKILRDQNRKCLICGKSIHLFGKNDGHRAHVDHNHTTNKVRGLLCPACNHGLGNFGDNQDILRAAIEYLRRND